MASILNATSKAALADGNSIPMIGFGTYLMNADETRSSVLAALKLGYRHIDTAQGYSTEAQVGEAIADSGLPREDIFITTKVFPGNPEWNKPAVKYEEVLDACQQSLQKLQTDYVDLYLIHAPFCAGTRLEQWKALLELKSRGLCRSVGVSNYGVKHLEEISAAGLQMPVANQLELHPYCGQKAVLEYMLKKNILPIAYSSLAPLSTWRCGQPSGKQDRGECMVQNEAMLEKIAQKYQVSESQVLLRWGLEKGYPILPKSTNVDRIKQNMDLFGFQLLEADANQLDNLDEGAPVAWKPCDPASSL